jgi:hypothetical protein
LIPSATVVQDLECLLPSPRVFMQVPLPAGANPSPYPKLIDAFVLHN